MAKCQHEWKWVPQRISTIGDVFDSNTICYNVQCSKCGAVEWAHGRNPCR